MSGIELIILSLMSVIVLLIFLYLYRESSKYQKIVKELGKEVTKALRV